MSRISGRGDRCIRIILTICTIIISSLIITVFWLLYERPVGSSTCLFSDLIHPVNSSSCRPVLIRNSNGETRIEQRCYPLLINFANGCCKKSQNLNCRSGIQHGVQQCLKLNRHMFADNPEFFKRNKHILKRSRGAGYWLWKSYAIYRELYLAHEGDVIIYSDAAATFIANISYLTRLTEEQDVIVFELMGQKEYQWTKRDAFIILGVDKPSYYNTSAKLASFVVVKKSLMSMTFVSEWLTYSQDSRVITDDKNVLGSANYKGFRENRHDQSILSLLAKKWKLKIYIDPSQWGVSHDRTYPTILNQHRIKS